MSIGDQDYTAGVDQQGVGSPCRPRHRGPCGDCPYRESPWPMAYQWHLAFTLPCNPYAPHPYWESVTYEPGEEYTITITRSNTGKRFISGNTNAR